MEPQPSPSLGRDRGARIIAISNQKGGCGKTVLAVNLAASLARLKRKVLVVDLDVQRNATLGLGIDPEKTDATMAEALLTPATTPMEEVVLETDTEGLHVAPGSVELASFHARMAREVGRESRLRRALAPLLGIYDFILVDTPPSLGLLTVNAFAASQEILVPLQLHPFGFDGLDALVDTVGVVREELNPAISISGIVISMFNGRIRIQKEILKLLEERPDLAPLVYQSCIRATTLVPEANEARMPLADFAPDTAVARDFENLAREFLERHPSPKETPDIASIKNRILELNRLSKAKIGSPGEAEA